MLHESQVRELARRRGHPVVTTFYLDVDGRRYPRASDLTPRVDALFRQARDQARRFGKHVEAAVGSDLEQIGGWIHGGHDRHQTRGLAVFCCTATGLFETLSLPVAMHDQVTLGAGPDVAQLCALLAAPEPVLAVVVDREKSAMLWTESGEVQVLEGPSDPTPRRVDTDLEIGSFDRHAAELAVQHYRGVAHWVNEELQGRPAKHLVLSGPEAAVNQLQHELPRAVKDLIGGTLALPISTREADVASAALDVARSVQRREQAALVRDLRGRAEQDASAVTGLAATLEALSAGTAKTLLVEEGFAAPGAYCPECGELLARGIRCPRCRAAPIAVDNVVDAAVTEAFTHHVDLEFCPPGDLADVGRIGALQRPRPGPRSATSHPLEVARAWATSLSKGDVVGALSLYSPEATVEEGDESLTGGSALRAWLLRSPFLGSARRARVRREGGEVVISFEATTPTEPEMAVSCRVAHGEIIGQRVLSTAGPETVVLPGHAEPSRVAVSSKGDVGEEIKVRAIGKVLEVAERLKEPVLFVRIKVAWEPNPARDRPATAEVVLDVNGELVRSHVSSHTLEEAVDLLADRLRDRLEHRSRRRQFLHRSNGAPSAGEWRHGDLPTVRPSYFDRPLEERELERHKTFAGGELTLEEAVFDMEQLDFDFYLFRDLTTGSDSMIERVEDGSYRMSRIGEPARDVSCEVGTVVSSPQPVPRLNLDDAIERLNLTAADHVFYADVASGRGNVLYRRYDGNYGLITAE